MDPDFDLRRIGRRLLCLFAVLTIPYALLCAVMYVQQRSLIYLPQHTHVPATQTNFALARDDVTLRGWRVNSGTGPALLYFGGNAESLAALREPMALWLPGHTVYLLAYRSYGASDGKPSESALVDDAVALFDHVRQQHAGQPITVIGRSLGGGVAARLAGQRPVDRLVLVTPFDSLAAVAAGHYPWLPIDLLLRDRYDAASALANHHQPVLVIRADHDEIIPTRRTDALIAGLPVTPTVITLPRTGHNFDLFNAAGTSLSAFMQPADGAAYEAAKAD